jgi:hypothetical protein
MMRAFSIDDLILINKWSQGVIEDRVILDFIAEKSKDDLVSFLVSCGELARQASACSADAEEAIKQVPFKRTRSACVILGKGVSMQTYRKLEALKFNDGKDAALLLLFLFKNADKRRREKDQVDHHWWHRDLSDPVVVAKIKNDYEAGVLV